MVWWNLNALCKPILFSAYPVFGILPRMSYDIFNYNCVFWNVWVYPECRVFTGKWNLTKYVWVVLSWTVWFEAPWTTFKGVSKGTTWSTTQHACLSPAIPGWQPGSGCSRELLGQSRYRRRYCPKSWTRPCPLGLGRIREWGSETDRGSDGDGDKRLMSKCVFHNPMHRSCAAINYGYFVCIEFLFWLN